MKNAKKLWIPIAAALVVLAAVLFVVFGGHNSNVVYLMPDGMAAILDAMAMRQFKWNELGKRLENKRRTTPAGGGVID